MLAFSLNEYVKITVRIIQSKTAFIFIKELQVSCTISVAAISLVHSIESLDIVSWAVRGMAACICRKIPRFFSIHESEDVFIQSIF